jgi:diguanylate cyclase (GGDEF)-like protein
VVQRLAPLPIASVMSHPLPWLTSHVRRAAEKCGADGASVYVPTPWNPTTPGMLVHVGNGAPLPELATLEAAVAFANEAATRLGTPSDGNPAPVSMVPSAVPEGCFIPIPLLETLWHRTSMSGAGGDDGKAQSRRLADRRGGPPIVGWLGLRFPAAPDSLSLPGGWQTLLELASALASTYVCFYGILTDPVTGLPGRAELNGTLRAELERAQANGLPFSLLFVKLDGLDGINERLGRRTGDTALREFLEVLHSSIRSSDTVMRYGGAVFALPLRNVAPSGALVLGRKIQRRIGEHAFLNGTVVLPCAVGIVSCEGAESASLQALDLLRRADQALSVSLRDGCHEAVLWRPDGDMATVEHLDPLLGVFTGQTEKDYRNMRLLWDVLQALSSSTGAELAQTVVFRMVSLFAATRAALFQQGDKGLEFTAGQQRLADSDVIAGLSSNEIEPGEWRLNQDALASLAPQQRSLKMAGHVTTLTAIAVPLVLGGRALGTLYLLGGSEILTIDENDFPILDGVAAQLALAFDRDHLAQQQRTREHHERQQLRAELDMLSRVLKQAQFVFRSGTMAELLDTTRRVAATDATVLITGESGTGKELLAHTLHELSGRRDKPLVIVDCGAIPASLMDSELFGRERGAYTDAERRAEGRLAQADGGTVFLDEIGELPLEVQAKLLRFVQEKTITMVGGTRPHKVDVRIIAATNRSLEDEVRAGHFRGDLFHRLNVVRLRIPPLRERPEDVLFLARHFLEGFARQYAKKVTDLDAGAERLLEGYDWPGNVRELQNTILQAVVLAEGDVVRADDLQLPGTMRPSTGDRVSRPAPVAVKADETPAISPAARPQAARAETPRSFDEAKRVLADRLGVEIAAAITSGARLGLPIGKWLARDVVLEAYEQAGAVASRAAAALGVPETTFSRHLAQAEAEAATTKKPESWTAVRSALADLLRAPGRPAGNLADHLEDLLLGLVVARVPHNLPQAAGLMGVSVPTMKRRLSHARQADGTLVGA